ncbi:MAG: D-alanyl-D-alanine carboxypeptidase family protein [Ktedonobacterales bacterium]
MQRRLRRGTNSLACAVLLAALLAACGASAAHGAIPTKATTSAVVPQADRMRPIVAVVSAAPQAPRIAVSAHVALLINRDTGYVYYAVNADTQVPMASTTKIMTALTAIAFGNLDASITVGADVSRLSGSGASVAGLQPGEMLTLRQLLYGLLLPSGDDAAIAIADGVAGSEARFIQLMNLEAVLLGLGHTHYANVHGLDAPGHYTTARDLATLTAAALQSPVFAQVVATPTYTLAATASHQPHVWQTTNLLLSTQPYAGVDGVKTGYTGGAGDCLVFTATRPYGRLLGVLLGEPDAEARFTDAEALLNWGFGDMRHPPAGVPAGGHYGVS